MPSDRVSLIAEVAQAHEGSLGIAHSYIDALAGTGVDAIKFQVHIAEAESSPFEQFRIKFSREDASRFDYWKRMQFTADQWAEVKNHCEERGVEFMASPFSVAALELLEAIGVKQYKVGSGEISNFLLIDRIAATGKAVILSSGLSSYEELDAATSMFGKSSSTYSILQCTTAYPTRPEEWGLNVLQVLRERFDCKVGFSDHSGNMYACLAAAALGAEILEFHAVFDQRMFGPDATSSLPIDEITRLTAGVRMIERALANPVDKNRTGMYSDLKIMFGKSLAVNKDLKKGHKIQLHDLESKKPAEKGIAASDYRSVINRVIKRDLGRYTFLQSSDLQ